MKMISTAYTPEEAKEETYEAEENEAPKYPWGLTLCLNDDMLEKLGIDKMEVGTMVTVMARAKVTGYSERELQDETEKYLDLQLTDLGIDSGSTMPTEAMYDGAGARK